MNDNYWENNLIYDRLSEKYGSKYAAVMCIAKEARYLCETNENVISHSTGLNWVVTNQPPKRLLSPKARLSYQDRLYLDGIDILNYIDDENVKQSVIDSVDLSRSSNHLIYVYSESLDEYQEARVRILTKLIWETINTGSVI